MGAIDRFVKKRAFNTVLPAEIGTRYYLIFYAELIIHSQYAFSKHSLPLLNSENYYPGLLFIFFRVW